MNKEKCRDKGLIPALNNEMAVLDGCSYEEKGSYIKDGKMYQVLECRICGYVNEAWNYLSSPIKT